MTDQRQEPSLPSWLELELHALGELPPERALAVERALAEDEETRRCFELAKEPVALNPLPELPSARPLRSRTAKARAGARIRWLAPLAAAAALVLLLGRAGDQETFPGPRVRVKGGDVAVTLVRNRASEVADRPETFAPEDRFKVLVTCPPGLEGAWDVVVVQGGDVFFPLDPADVAACGNENPLPGAFALDGTARATVCVVRRVLGGERPSTEQVRAGKVGEAAACAALRPER